MQARLTEREARSVTFVSESRESRESVVSRGALLCDDELVCEPVVCVSEYNV